ncbi:porin [Alteromonas gilva]|uniref:Porin n=1 Tax=Alteromonas gilva TaxID=2987522 RepID=A0ABT5KZB8_9ALTE|nr:porin [Alteromonas gilva]MDC8830105.1 porin [Alteromonas gilva]
MIAEKKIRYFYYPLLAVLLVGQSVCAEPLDASVSYQKNGFTFETADNNFKMQIQGRIQSRFATPSDSQPTALDDYTSYSSGGDEFGINRARLKIKGHAYRPWLKFAIEHDFVNSRLLTYTVNVEKYDWLKFKAGQWKFEYSRERSISSGGQQLLDRSIINRIFTIDRQQGAAIYGDLGGQDMTSFSYWLGIGTGNGLGSNRNDGGAPLYYGRLQWNITGKNFGFKASDLQFSQSLKANVAVAYSSNESAFTRFSSSAGGQLEGFDAGIANQYKIDQYNIDFALKYRGLNAQGEYHEKTITDSAQQDAETDYRGFYVQAGYFGHAAFEWWPKPLELALRYATYHETDNLLDEKHFERAVAANWFFNGHNNKLTADITQFDIEQVALGSVDEVRYRLQWDLSF